MKTLQLIVLLGALATSCGEASPGKGAGNGGTPDAGPDEVLLIVDGLSITRAQVHEFDDYVLFYDSKVGRKHLARHVLDDFVLPTALARRAFAAERRTLFAKAKELSDACQIEGLEALLRYGKLQGGYPWQRKVRSKLRWSLGRWAFDEEHLLAVSPPLEMPQGFYVIAAESLEPELSRAFDRVTVYLVPFLTHVAAGTFQPWLRGEKERIADRVEYVHPELEGALPPWLQAN